MGDSEKHFRELRHTADVSIEVWGDDFGALLAHAAEAVFELEGLPEEQRESVERRVQVDSLDRESLLVDWLNELLYLSEINGEMYTRFEVESATTQSVRAIARGIKGRPTVRNIKATTFHDLRIDHTPDRWQAQIVFDV